MTGVRENLRVALIYIFLTAWKVNTFWGISGPFFSFCWELSAHISSPFFFDWTIYFLDSWIFFYILESDLLDVSLAMLLSFSMGLFFDSLIVHIDVQKLCSLQGPTCQLLPLTPEQVLFYSESSFLHPYHIHYCWRYSPFSNVCFCPLCQVLDGCSNLYSCFSSSILFHCSISPFYASMISFWITIAL